MMRAIAADTKIPGKISDAEFKKCRDKLIKLFDDTSKMIQIPPQYSGMVNFKSIELEMKKELPKFREKLPTIIEETTAILECGTMDFQGAFNSIMATLDYLGRELKISGIQIGIFQGILQSVLVDQYYIQNLHSIVGKIVAGLKA